MADNLSIDITVIVPVYNVEPYLSKCVDSLLNQTISGYEIILVDDGSTDHSGAICDRYAASHPHLVRVIHQQNKGLSAARNTGIEASQAQILSFVDSDDWVEPFFLEILYNNLIKANADLSCCGLVDDYDNGKINIAYSLDTITLTSSEAFQHTLLNPQFYGYACNKLWRKDYLNNLRFDTALRSAEDMDFTVKYLPRISKAVHNSTPLYHYRKRIGSMTGEFAFSPTKLSVLEVNRRLIEVYGRFVPELLDIVISNFVKTNLNILGRMKISGHRDDNLKAHLKQNISQYWRSVMRSKSVSLSTKMNMWLTRLSPGGMLRAKQAILKRKYHS